MPISQFDSVVRRFGTVYILCGVCGMDMCWPSWCKCKPQRVLYAADITEILRGSDDTTHDIPNDQGRAGTP